MPPTWEERVCYYCTYLIKVDKLKSSTIRSYISGIKDKLRGDGYSWNDNLILFKSLVSTCKEANDNLKNRLPIQQGLFRMINFELNRAFSKETDRIFLIVLYRAIFMFLYHGLMRIGEVVKGDHVVLAKNVHQASNKTQILIVLYSSKTHGKGDLPQKIKIKNQDFDSKEYTPVEEINKYIALRPPYITDNEQFFVFRDNTPVTPNQVRKVLRNLIEQTGLDGDNYDTHSFRIGRATDQFKFGIDIEKIKKYGRWESNAIYDYLRS